MKNKIFKILLVLVVFCLMLTGCSSKEDSYDIEAEQAVFDMGEQDITIISKSDSLSFKGDIKASSVVLDDGLKGIDVTSVIVINTKKISIHLSGKAEKRADSSTMGKIIIKSNALSIDGNAICYTSVNKPSITTMSFRSSMVKKDGVASYDLSGDVYLDGGYFTDDIIGNALPAIGVTIKEIAYTLNDDGSLNIKITGCNVNYPEITLTGGITSFNMKITFKLGLSTTF